MKGVLMTEKRKPRTFKTERQHEQRRTSQKRREYQQLAERYEARPLLPEPDRESEGVYRP
jgi:hypothetical protein